MSSQPLLLEVGRPGLPSRVTVFASGANEAREIRGFALAGVPVGVAVSHIRESAICELIRTGGPVFADSGAFSEVEIDASGINVVAPISHREWQRRLAIYKRLAESLRRNLSVVAPDRVADQNVTLSRLAQYRSELADIATLGAEILIPVQNGELSPADFYRNALGAAGLDLVPAMPMKKAATSFTEVLAFVREIRPARLHLLGMGYERSRARQLVRLLQAFSPDLHITMDSNRIRAVTGRDRKMTRLESSLRDEEPESLYSELESEALKIAGCRLDYTDSVAYPSTWASLAQLESIADEGCISGADRDEFLASPDELLQRPVNDIEEVAYIELPHLAHALDNAWMSYVRGEIDCAVRIAAIRQTFTGSRISSVA
jgi:hypothetical protein